MLMLNFQSSISILKFNILHSAYNIRIHLSGNAPLSLIHKKRNHYLTNLLVLNFICFYPSASVVFIFLKSLKSILQHIVY